LLPVGVAETVPDVNAAVDGLVAPMVVLFIVLFVIVKPDYDEMIASSDVVIHDVIKDAILESDVGPRILYHLAENEDFAQKFAGMPLPQALKELGKLEMKYSPSEEKAVAVRKSKAPPPINPIKGTSGAVDTPINEKGEFTGTIQQWKEMRKSGKIR